MQQSELELEKRTYEEANETLPVELMKEITDKSMRIPVVKRTPIMTPTKTSLSLTLALTETGVGCALVSPRVDITTLKKKINEEDKKIN